MNCRDILYTTVLFVLLPMWIGYLWVELLKLKDGWSRLVHAWVMGFATMLAVAQVILVPLVALKATLTLAMILWQAALSALSVCSFFLLLRRLKSWKLFGRRAEKKKWQAWSIVFGVLAAVMILIQAYIPARYEHGDDDDARFIAEEVSAVVHDTMYIDDPIAGELMYWNQGEVKKDLTSPWAMYMAMCARISDIPPAVLSHTYAPFFLILLCYAVYLLIGHVLMRATGKRPFCFWSFCPSSICGGIPPRIRWRRCSSAHLAG